MKVCVLIRVYNRIEDLVCNLQIIRDTWNMYDYEIVVVSNGESDGYILPPKVYILSDKVIRIENNVGHLKGNSQLLLEGLKDIELTKYPYLIILEADTWIYTDKIINKYIAILNMKEAVWASARWYDRYYSLATDFALLKTDFLINNIEIFNFSDYPECYVFNYLLGHGYSSIYIKENMPTHLPGYIRKYPYAPRGRFYVFPKSMMVTHHIENIKGGMNEKKSCFNAIAGKVYFKDVKNGSLKYQKIKISIVLILSRLLIRRNWYTKGEMLNFVDV